MATLGQVEQANLTANSDVSSTLNTTQGALGKLDVDGATSGQNVANNADNLIFKHGAYDFVGIANLDGVVAMSEAIDTYCNNVNEILEGMETTANPEGTFAGEYATAINEFIVAIQSSCMANVNSLKTFQKDLKAVYAAMQAKDTSVLDSISTDASSINSTVSEGSE